MIMGWNLCLCVIILFTVKSLMRYPTLTAKSYQLKTETCVTFVTFYTRKRVFQGVKYLHPQCHQLLRGLCLLINIFIAF